MEAHITHHLALAPAPCPLIWLLGIDMHIRGVLSAFWSRLGRLGLGLRLGGAARGAARAWRTRWGRPVGRRGGALGDQGVVERGRRSQDRKRPATRGRGRGEAHTRPAAKVFEQESIKILDLWLNSNRFDFRSRLRQGYLRVLLRLRLLRAALAAHVYDRGQRRQEQATAERETNG